MDGAERALESKQARPNRLIIRRYYVEFLREHRRAASTDNAISKVRRSALPGRLPLPLADAS